MNKILLYVLYFFFYSAVGWLFESTYCSLGERKFINRGFLFGPMCPIYGTGALVMAVLLYEPFRDKPLVVLLLGMVLCDIVEYLTSFIMEKLFNARWWDYKNELFNIHGRICLKHTLIWGLGSLGFVRFIHPVVEKLFSKLSPDTVIRAVAVILVIFVIDLIFAVIKATDIRKLILKLYELYEAAQTGAEDAKTLFEEKYSDLKLALDGKYDSLITAVSDRYDRINRTIDEENDKINYKRDELILLAIYRVQRAEEKIRRKTGFDKDTIKLKRNLSRLFKKSKGKHNLKAVSAGIKNLTEEISQAFSSKK